MMPSERLIQLVPGAYLLATRYPGLIAAGGYIWLEILPVTAMLCAMLGWKGLLYPLLQYPFLALYELGYLDNDRAATAAERRDRRKPSLSSPGLTLFIAIRIALIALATLAIALYADVESAVLYLAVSVSVLLLLGLHTRAGLLSGDYCRSRYVTFAWLAFSKYSPGAVVLIDAKPLLMLLVLVFVTYGAGRTLNYVMDKEAQSEAIFPVNALWYLGALPIGVVLYAFQIAGIEVMVLVVTLGAYYSVSCLRKLTHAERRGE